MKYYNFYRASRSPQFIRHFFNRWLPRWRNVQPFTLRFYAYNNYRLEFLPEADIFQTDRLILSLEQKDLNWELRTWRLQKSLSAKDMATLCKMSLSNYSALERGKRPFGVKTRKQILSAIETYAELFKGQENTERNHLNRANLRNLKAGNLLGEDI
jgi:hypothetical protein